MKRKRLLIAAMAALCIIFSWGGGSKAFAADKTVFDPVTGILHISQITYNNEVVALELDYYGKCTNMPDQHCFTLSMKVPLDNNQTTQTTQTNSANTIFNTTITGTAGTGTTGTGTTGSSTQTSFLTLTANKVGKYSSSHDNSSKDGNSNSGDNNKCKDSHGKETACNTGSSGGEADNNNNNNNNDGSSNGTTGSTESSGSTGASGGEANNNNNNNNNDGSSNGTTGSTESSGSSGGEAGNSNNNDGSSGGQPDAAKYNDSTHTLEITGVEVNDSSYQVQLSTNGVCGTASCLAVTKVTPTTTGTTTTGTTTTGTTTTGTTTTGTTTTGTTTTGTTTTGTTTTGTTTTGTTTTGTTTTGTTTTPAVATGGGTLLKNTAGARPTIGPNSIGHFYFQTQFTTHTNPLQIVMSGQTNYEPNVDMVARYSAGCDGIYPTAADLQNVVAYCAPVGCTPSYSSAIGRFSPFKYGDTSNEGPSYYGMATGVVISPWYYAISGDSFEGLVIDGPSGYPKGCYYISAINNTASPANVVVMYQE